MMEYSPKAAALLDAAISLWEQGSPLCEITVSQLAQTAKVGKGTVYEYFSSREELLALAFLHRMDARLSALSLQVDADETFPRIMDTLFSAASDMLVLQKAALEAIELYVRTGRGAHELGPCPARSQQAKLEELLIRAVQKGQQEGALGPCSSCEALLAMKGILTGFAAYRQDHPQHDEAMLRACAQTLLRRALNGTSNEI